MNQLILVRHGQIQTTSEFRFYGQVDVPLSFRGRRQAHLVGQRLADMPLQALYSSDLLRACETAEICADYIGGLPIIRLPDLREIDVGLWANLTLTDVKQQFPDDFATWQQDRIYHKRLGGESFAELEARVLNSWQQIINIHQKGPIVIFCHAGTIRAFLSGFEIYDREDAVTVAIAHASFTTLAIQDKKVQLLSVNDEIHLEMDRNFIQRLQQAKSKITAQKS